MKFSIHKLAPTILLILALSLAACATTTPSGSGPAIGQPLATPKAQAIATAIPAVQQGAPVTGEVLGTIEVTGIDIGFTPNYIDLKAPGRYTVKFINDGVILHDIAFPDGTKLTAKGGETVTGDVMIPATGVKFICSIPGHKEAGMVGTIAINGAFEEEDTGETGGGHGGPAVASDVAPDPNAPKYTRFDPAAPKVLEGTTHNITLETIEKPMTVAPGYVQEVWTFGGTVPGPVIRVKVGDTVRVTLKNPANSRVPHSVDFHASLVAWNDEMTSINPGEEKIYEFKAEYAGVWMYHCGTNPALHHIANGMYGMIIVEPKEGLPPVDHEFAFVQNEWYLGPQGEPGSLTKAATAAPAPEFVVFNGVKDQYVDTPIQIGTGKRVRVFILNAGPSIDSSFHIVGTIFDTVIKEGVYLERGNTGNWGSQAVDLSPAQGAIVEFSMAEDGLYPMVTHAFNFVGRGALGLFQAGDGKPNN
jgi:nitrite reductase (NO-forming)